MPVSKAFHGVVVVNDFLEPLMHIISEPLPQNSVHNEDESLIVTWPVSFPKERGVVSSLSDTLVSGPPPASDFILGFLSHYIGFLSHYFYYACA